MQTAGAGRLHGFFRAVFLATSLSLLRIIFVMFVISVKKKKKSIIIRPLSSNYKNQKKFVRKVPGLQKFCNEVRMVIYHYKFPGGPYKTKNTFVIN